MKTGPTPSRNADERALFLGALEIRAPAARRAYLDAACGKDPAVRRRVEELLREHEQLGGFLEAPAVAAAPARQQAGALGPHDTALVAAVTAKPGDFIGRYQLPQKIGDGGGGVVYSAEHEGTVNR